MMIPGLSGFQILHPLWLVLLPLVPLLGMLRGARGKRAAIQFPTAALLKDLGTPARSRVGGFVVGLILISLTFGILALSRPQKVLSYDEEKAEGISIMLTVDVSLSMLIEDFYIGGQPVNRLTAAKRVMADFIKGRRSDKIGIVAFAGETYLPCPLTMDRDWLINNLDRVQTQRVGDGTAIGSGIASAANRMRREKTPSKVIVLLTDGANNSGRLSPQDAAKLAATLGIKIYTIAIGTPGIHSIPDPKRGTFTPVGQQLFDEGTLKEVAAIGSGQFYMAQNLSSLSDVFATIDKLEKTKIEHHKIVETEELFPWPLAVCATALFLALLLSLTVLHSAPEPVAT
ncbi:VWA domain-containing protein [Prosthecobacter vanneervenii]|uniref:Ca-activated chloride channel family protein n=1 Tax=Prosthecobacter vanneervenii TaxID=48466 RepID=A0A7W7YA10_9BACT|nr:VWA domain-containing protein [Prosthecobacter vanneervenii]MBB5032172.1 Ca-activated chloride channel family protein [Prosthecobacter vanneervenii]